MCTQADADFSYSYGPGADEFAFLDRTKSAPDGEVLEVAPGVAAAAAEAAAWSRTATSQAGKARVWPEHQPPPGLSTVSPAWQRAGNCCSCCAPAELQRPAVCNHL